MDQVKGIADKVIGGLKLAKHRANKAWWWQRIHAKSRWFRTTSSVRPFTYDPHAFRTTFLAIDPPPPLHPMQQDVPRIIWTAWTGDNDLTPNRQAGLDSIKQANPDAEVILVTPRNLADYVVEGAPLHPIYDSLSLVHKSDYLRCYLLHHHGGAWTDIKTQRGRLTAAVDELNAHPDLWLVGWPLASIPYPLRAGLGWLQSVARRNYTMLISGSALAARAYSPHTTEWYAELLRRCSYYQEAAERHPGEVWGLLDPNDTNTQYPIHWNVLLAEILDPLSLKYADHIRLDEKFRPELDNHR